MSDNQEKKENKVIKYISIGLEVTLLLCLSMLFIRNTCYTPIVIDETSMDPTLKDNDYGYVLRTDYALKNIDRFDIVTCKVDGKQNELIKRVIGLPNETIEFIGTECSLYVNGVEFKQDFITPEVQAYTGNHKYVIPENSYLVLGDNRRVSVDSRAFGFVKQENMTGILKVIMASCKINENGQIISKEFKPFVYF